MLRDGLLRRSEASALRWGDVELQADGSARIHVRRSKTDPEAEGSVLYIGEEAALALQWILPEDVAVADPAAPVFGLSASQIGRRVKAAAKAASLVGWESFSGHSGRVGMAQDLAASGVELPELMTAGRWKTSRMPARYTERQAAGRGGGGPVLPEERELMADPWVSPNPHMQGLTLLSTFILQDEKHLRTANGDETTEEGMTWLTSRSLNVRSCVKRPL